MRTTPSTTRRVRVSRMLLATACLLFTFGCEPVPPPAEPDSRCVVAAVGDSLTVGIRPTFASALSARRCTLSWLDAAVGRRTAEGVSIIEQAAIRGQLPAVLVVGLGTNDAGLEHRFGGWVDRVMVAAAGREVFWVNTSYDKVKQSINATLRQRSEQYPNLTIIDWDSMYWANPSWRARDKIHCTPEGYAARSNLIANQIVTVVK